MKDYSQRTNSIEKESINNASSSANRENRVPQSFGLDVAFSMIVDGSMSSAKSEVAEIADLARLQGNTQVASFAGNIWTVADNLQKIQDGISEKQYGSVKSLSSETADLTRGLITVGVINSEVGGKIVNSAGGYWNLANEASKESEQSNGSAAANAQNSETIEQHRLPTDRGWAYCGIATSMMLLRANGLGTEDEAKEMNQLVSEMYIKGDGSAVALMDDALVSRGLTNAKGTNKGTWSQLMQTLESGQPVPFGITHISGEVVKMNQSQKSTFYSHLKPGDRHERVFGGAGHWVLVVGFEGSAENPTHFIFNDPDIGGQIRSTKAELEKMGVGNGEFYQVYQD